MVLALGHASYLFLAFFKILRDDPDNLKALYRRGLGHQAMGNLKVMSFTSGILLPAFFLTWSILYPILLLQESLVDFHFVVRKNPYDEEAMTALK